MNQSDLCDPPIETAVEDLQDSRPIPSDQSEPQQDLDTISARNPDQHTKLVLQYIAIFGIGLLGSLGIVFAVCLPTLTFQEIILIHSVIGIFASDAALIHLLIKFGIRKHSERPEE